MTTFTKTADGRTVPEYTYARGTVSEIGTVQLIASPGAATRNVIDYLKVRLAGSVATDGTVQFGTVAVDVFSSAQYGTFSFETQSPGQEWRLPADTALVFGAAGSAAFQWSARYFTESVY